MTPTILLYTPDTLVICATNRLAQYLKAQGVARQSGGRDAVCLTPQALTLVQWLDELFEEATLRGLTVAGLPPGVLPLDAYQERVLWERVIARSLGEHARALFDVASLARSAMEAHQLMVTWEVSPNPDAPTEEGRRLAEWCQLFHRECAARQRLDAARWQRALMAALPPLAPQLKRPGRVVFAGFARYNPPEARLRSALSELGWLGDDWVLGAPATGPVVTTCSYPDVAAEALAAALWAQERLGQQPQGRFALVVPDLAGHRHLLQDTLEDALMPAALWPGQAEAPRPFNISLGLPLTDYPVVATALQLLRLLNSAHRVEQPDFSDLLRGVYWSDAAGEGSARALLEADLRQRVAPAAPLQRWLQAVEAHPHAAQRPPQLLAHLRAALQFAESTQPRQKPSQWVRQLPGLLHQMGWLWERKLTSHEFQTRQAFGECVDALGRLDALLGDVTLPEATTHLRRLCQERTFQPQTEGQPRLQVLGLLEASGLDFDGLWVMGMQDSAWPPPARPNPLLPAEAQRQAQAPNASATVQLAFAQALHQTLLRAAPEVVLSWARTAGAAELNPSPLLPPTPEGENRPAPTSPHWTVQAVQAAAMGHSPLEPPLEDALAPAVAPGERVNGGTWLLRAQAICPAWGYFQYRLGAGRLEEPVDGLDARQRGTLVHKALECFWQRVQTSTALQALSPADRTRLIAEAVDHALQAHQTDPRNEALKPRFMQLERERLTRLLQGWLLLELKRELPFAVIDNERKAEVDIQGLRFRMTVDRIDQLEDGSLLVIDYKTGARIDTKNWATDRLTEPQLPIYAAITPQAEGPVEGVVFAKVLMGEPEWAGLTRHDTQLPKVKAIESASARRDFPADRFPDWGSVLRHWRQCIEGVAQEIQAGEAGVRFNRPEDLRYCDVKPLLRLDERQAQWQAAPGERP